MFKLHDSHTRKNIGLENSAEQTDPSSTSQRPLWRYTVDIFIVIAMGAILFWGISTQFPNQFNDVTRYQCYANVFWKGSSGLATLPKQQCAFLAASSSSSLVTRLQAHRFPSFLIHLVEAQSTSQPLHALPPEYPLLTLVPFSLSLIGPPQVYQIIFAIEMAIIAAAIYFLLKQYRSTGAAIAFALYLAIGNWATAEGRFDLIPAGLTLGAVLLAQRMKWKWAFSLLALATLLKFYPVVLVLPFLVAQQSQNKQKWLARERWSALCLFVGLCIGGTILSLLLNVASTLEPINYFVNRPTQIESLQASLLWLGNFFGFKTSEVFTYQSLNMISPLASKVSLLGTVCLIAGLLYISWLQWRGNLNIALASLLTLLIVMLMGKVFSPQYLIWVTPLIAYIGKANWKWLVGWISIGALTTLIFPFLYDNYLVDKYFWIIVVRNILMLLFVLALLYHATQIACTNQEQSASTPITPEYINP